MAPLTRRSLRFLGAALALAGCSDDTHGHDDAAADVHVHDDATAQDVTATDSATDSATDASATDAPPSGNTEIRFAAKVGAMPFACTSTYTNMGASSATWVPLDFRLYVHDVRLLTASGAEVPLTLTQDGTFQYQNLALLDFENRGGTCVNGNVPTNAVVRGTLPAGMTGPFTGVRFKLGVPFALNHGDAATQPSPLNLTSLWWNWQGGHKFLRIDGRITDAMGAVLVPSWNIHLGSTGCNGTAAGGVTTCANPNRPEVTLMGFDPSRNTIVADLGLLVAGADLSRSVGAPGCMSDPSDTDCAPVFSSLGISFGGTPGTQRFFRVE